LKVEEGGGKIMKLGTLKKAQLDPDVTRKKYA